MPGDAEDTIRRFWAIQDDGDYSKLTPLFADDAVVVDPFYGTFEGAEAIAGFFARMNEVVPAAGVRFRLVDVAGDDHVAWAQWEAVSERRPGDPVSGVGVYRVRDGRLTYYRDYQNAPAPPK